MHILYAICKVWFCTFQSSKIHQNLNIGHEEMILYKHRSTCVETYFKFQYVVQFVGILSGSLMLTISFYFIMSLLTYWFFYLLLWYTGPVQWPAYNAAQNVATN